MREPQNYENIRAGGSSHLAHKLATKGIDDACHRWVLALADEVKVKHPLDSPGLQTTIGRLVLLATELGSTDTH